MKYIPAAALFSKVVSLEPGKMLKKDFISDIFPENCPQPFRTYISWSSYPSKHLRVQSQEWETRGLNL